MKHKAVFILALCMALSGLAAYVVAQQAAPTNPESKLSQAHFLINSGDPQAARELLATIPKDDPDFVASRYYDALALAVTQDRLGFLKALEKLSTNAPPVPREVAPDVEAHRIEALLFHRSFEEALPRAQAFQTQHADSLHAAAVREYLLAILFERGVKKTFEACKLEDETKFNERWTEGRSNLEQFLSLATSSALTNYSVLPKRNLRDDLWAARVILGDETTALQEIAGLDLAHQEKFGLLRARLYPKIQPKQASQNLHRMSDFLKAFPESPNRARLELEMADVALVEGERLVKVAGRLGDGSEAATVRANAAAYFDFARPLFSRVVENEEAGIGASELREAREGILRAHFAQADWANLSSWAAQMLANAPEEKEWVVAKLYHGAGLARQRKSAEAAKELDEVLAVGFKGSPSYDGMLISAARWRIRVAQGSGDEATARRVVQDVQNSICMDSLKRAFLKQFETLVVQPIPAAQ
jgi:hypothetical protein